MPEVSDFFERLCANIIPINYHLTIFPNLKTFEFKGSVKIDLKVKILIQILDKF